MAVALVVVTDWCGVRIYFGISVCTDNYLQLHLAPNHGLVSMAHTSQRQHEALKNVLLIVLLVLNVIQLYIIVADANSDSVSSVSEMLQAYLPVKCLFGIFETWNAWKGSVDVDTTPNVYPRPETEIKIENVSIKWSRSVDRLQYLASHESSLHQLMKEYKLGIQAKLDLIEGWIEDYESTSVNAKSNEEIASHPFLALAMLRRFSALKSNMSRAFTEQEMEARMKEMASETQQALPDSSDYEDAILNIINLRYVYDLSITDLMNGKLKDTQTAFGLTPEHAYEIAVIAEKDSAYSEAFYWYEALLEKLKTEDPNLNGSRLTIKQIEADIDRIIVKHDELFDRITAANFWDYYHRFATKMNSTPKEKWRTVKQTIIEEGWHKEKDSVYPAFQFQSHELCAGQSYLTELEQARLICFYDKKTDPHWVLSPLKVEVYSWDPYLIRIYDVISESTIEYLMSSGRNLMTEAPVVNNEYNNTQESDSGDNSSSQVPFSIPSRTRVGLSTFLQAKSNNLKVLYRKISSMTGLKCEYTEHYPTEQNPLSAEDMYIGSYAFGGHYELHYDSFLENQNITLSVEGNRVATFMIYLNDVTSGGHTVFPTIGVGVKPIRNSVVFWYNLHRNGTRDSRTMHAGCPVILGHKWIANVWILSFASFLERKCSLNSNE